jgi:hypothetical protein
LWQQKLQIKEEGYRRPQDAVLGIQGLRSGEQHQAQSEMKLHGDSTEGKPFSVSWSDPKAEGAKVEELFRALTQARKQTGEKSTASLESFKKFVQQKTQQLRKEYDCNTVEYAVELQGGQVKLKARPK